MAADHPCGTLNPFRMPTGPLGHLAGWVMGRDPGALVCGVDPSPVMLGQARRRLDRVGVAARADLRLGVAGALPFPDHYADHVVAVNTAVFWPDLHVALVDARRVVRPGGSVLIAWHSTTSPRRVQRAIAAPQPWWDETMSIARRVFGNAERHDLTYTSACTAVAP